MKAQTLDNFNWYLTHITVKGYVGTNKVISNNFVTNLQIWNDK